MYCVGTHFPYISKDLSFFYEIPMLLLYLVFATTRTTITVFKVAPQARPHPKPLHHVFIHTLPYFQLYPLTCAIKKYIVKPNKCFFKII